MEGWLHILGEAFWPQGVPSCPSCWVCNPNGHCSRTWFQLEGVLCPQEERHDHLTCEMPQYQVLEEDIGVQSTSAKVGRWRIGHRQVLWLHPKGRCHCQRKEECQSFIQCSRGWQECSTWIPVCQMPSDLWHQDGRLPLQSTSCCWQTIDWCPWYASVVMRETVHIALMLDALNSLEVMAADMMNAYITTQCKKRYDPLLVLSLEKTKARKPYSKSPLWPQAHWPSLPWAPCQLHVLLWLQVMPSQPQPMVQSL